jgi:hypothetical protein
LIQGKQSLEKPERPKTHLATALVLQLSIMEEWVQVLGDAKMTTALSKLFPSQLILEINFSYEDLVIDTFNIFHNRIRLRAKIVKHTDILKSSFISNLR